MIPLLQRSFVSSHGYSSRPLRPQPSWQGERLGWRCPVHASRDPEGAKRWRHQDRIKGQIFRWYIYHLSQVWGRYHDTSDACTKAYLFTVKLQTTEKVWGGLFPMTPHQGQDISLWMLLPAVTHTPHNSEVNWLPCGERSGIRVW